MACKSKTAHHRAKWSEIWDSWILVTYIWGTYDLVVFKVIWGSFSALVSKWPVSQKGLVVERNGVKFMNHAHYLYIYRVIWPCGVQGQFGVIQCTCLKMACISKRAGHRAKRSEIWDSWTIVINIWGTFELVGFKVILGSFGALVSKWPVSRKGLVVERNGVKFGTHGH